MTDRSSPRSGSDDADRVVSCTHCGAPAAGRTAVVFERASERIDLWLCEGCLDSITAEDGVHLPE
jgi:hypothetical protein